MAQIQSELPFVSVKADPPASPPSPTPAPASPDPATPTPATPTDPTTPPSGDGERDPADEASDKCAEHFKEDGRGWTVGSVIGRVFCWFGRGVGKVFSVAIQQSFEIDKIVKERDRISSLDGQIDARGNKWALDVWNFSIKLVDIIAVVMLIIIAFANILHIDLNTYAVKRILPVFIGALITAHLSWFIISALFAFSNALVPESFIKGIETGIAALARGLGTVSSVIFIWGIMSPLLLIVPILVLVSVMIAMYVLGMILTFQPVVVSIVAMVAPIAIILVVFPKTRNYFNKWLTVLMNWIFMWPLTIFILFLVGEIVTKTNLGMILEAQIGALSPGGEGFSESLLKALVSASPLIVALLLFVFAVRLPFMLGKDAITIVNSAKQGFQALTEMGTSAVGKAGSVMQHGAEAAGGIYQYGVNRRAKGADIRALRAAKAQQTREGEKIEMGEALRKVAADSRQRMNVRRAALRGAEDLDATAAGNEHERLRATAEQEIDRISSSDIDDDEKKEKIGKIHRKLEGNLQKATLGTEAGRMESLREFLVNDPRVIGEAGDRPVEDYIAENIEQEDGAVSSALTAWEERYKGQAGVGDDLEKNYAKKLFNRMRTLGVLNEPTKRELTLGRLATIVRGEIEPRRGTNEEGFVERQKIGLTNMGIAAVNKVAHLLNPLRSATILENARSTVGEKEAELQKRRREQYLGTSVFEKLAGEQVAGSTVAGEYAEKYRFWQFPELLAEVRRLRLNLSPDQLSRLVEQSPRKAWPMARKMGYSGTLDDFAKLYMASNFLKSAGRSYGAATTFSEMLTTGQPAYEIQQRRYGRGGSGFFPASGGELPAQTENVSWRQAVDVFSRYNAALASGKTGPEVVRLQRESARLLSALTGTAVSESTAKAMVTTVAPQLEKVQSATLQALDAIGENPSLSSSEKIAAMLSRLGAAEAARVGSSDISLEIIASNAAVTAYQSFQQEQGIKMSEEQARRELAANAQKVFNERIGAVTPDSPGGKS